MAVLEGPENLSVYESDEAGGIRRDDSVHFDRRLVPIKVREFDAHPSQIFEA
jgi:hypothetical protein